MMRPFLAVVALIAMPVASFAEVAPDPTVLFETDDPEMTKAIAAAQETLPLFLLNTVDDDGYGPNGGYLKVQFPVGTQPISNENIWVGPFLALNGADFVGLLANQPEAMPGLNAGDQVSFTYDMIVDWNLDAGGGQYYGDYTTRVVISRLSPEEAEALAGRFIDPSVPAEWAN